MQGRSKVLKGLGDWFIEENGGVQCHQWVYPNLSFRFTSEHEERASVGALRGSNSSCNFPLTSQRDRHVQITPDPLGPLGHHLSLHGSVSCCILIAWEYDFSNKCLLSTYYFLGTSVGMRDSVVNRFRACVFSWGLHSGGRRDTKTTTQMNKIITSYKWFKGNKVLW